MIINIDLKGESDEMYEVSDFILKTSQQYFDEDHRFRCNHLIKRNKRYFYQDGVVVMMVSIAAITLIIGIVFKSALLPIILVLLIQTAVWVNIAIPYFKTKHYLILAF